MEVSTAFDGLPELDVASEAYQKEPFPIVEALHEDTRLAKSSRGLEVLAYDLIVDLLRDRRLTPPRTPELAARGATPALIEFCDFGLKMTMTAENHLRTRRIFNKGFAQSKIDDLRPWMRDLAEELIDDIDTSAPFDLVASFSDRFSISVLCKMIGLPMEDIDTFAHNNEEIGLWASDPLEPVLGRVDAALVAQTGYARKVMDERRREPRDDVITELVQMVDDEGTLSEAECANGIVDLMFAGHDTTRLQIPGVARAAMEHGYWGRLRGDKGMISDAVEEGMRHYPAAAYITRFAREEVEIDGVTVGDGAHVVLNLNAASRDPQRYPDPGGYRLDRDANFDVVFGAGLHRCLGHYLARAEVQESMAVLTARLPGLELTGEYEIGPGGGTLMNGFTRLMVGSGSPGGR